MTSNYRYLSRRFDAVLGTFYQQNIMKINLFATYRYFKKTRLNQGFFARLLLPDLLLVVGFWVYDWGYQYSKDNLRRHEENNVIEQAGLWIRIYLIWIRIQHFC
jgi:hypothetical protein